MDRYIGLDAHASSCTAAVVGPSGRRLQSQVFETNARALVRFLKTLPKPRHLCLEEGTHAGWLYEIPDPHVQEIVVVGVDQSRGPKDDKRDAFALAEGLRIGAIRTRVYKGLGEFKLLRELSRAYSMTTSDSIRVQNRIKSTYRSRGIPTDGKAVYRPARRDEWLKLLPSEPRRLAATLFRQLDSVRELQKQTEKEMLTEARRHEVFGLLTTCPGMGNMRIRRVIPVFDVSDCSSHPSARLSIPFSTDSAAPNRPAQRPRPIEAQSRGTASPPLPGFSVKGLASAS